MKDPRSICCNKPVTVAGTTTKYHICSACGKACDELPWKLKDIHPVYGTVVMAGMIEGEAYRWFEDWSGTVSMIPLEVLMLHTDFPHSEPCERCGKTPTQMEPRFNYYTCEKCSHISPVKFKEEAHERNKKLN